MLKLSFLKSHWWTPLLSTSLIGGFLLFLLPPLPLILFNSRSGLLGLLLLGCVVLPWITSSLHHISPLPTTIAFYSVMVVGWLLQPASFDGNQKLALATYLMPWMLLALVVHASMMSFMMRKKVSK